MIDQLSVFLEKQQQNIFSEVIIMLNDEKT